MHDEIYYPRLYFDIYVLSNISTVKGMAVRVYQKGHRFVAFK